MQRVAFIAALIGWTLAVVLGLMYRDVDRDSIVTRTSLSQCMGSMDSIHEGQKKNTGVNTSNRKAAADAARVLDKLAENQLTTPPSQPGNDCGSAEDRAKAWLENRR